MQKSPSMVDVIEELAHTRVHDCYQCGKCSAGCPMADRMDVIPSQIMRLVQMERLDKAMKAESIWLCVSCQTCSTRCPKSVNIAGVIDALRQLSVEQNVASPAQQRTVVFQKAFLDNIRRNGRLKELELVGFFKVGAFLKGPSLTFLFKDSLLAPKMMTRGKFHLLGESVKDRDVVRRIFDRCMGSPDTKDKG
ncbi:MAG: heterodisulfide reductase subunit C [Planctomycetes bacterium]|nr:heterodisulfide reductase subunit C [Planctomycetota bacterium]